MADEVIDTGVEAEPLAITEAAEPGTQDDQIDQHGSDEAGEAGGAGQAEEDQPGPQVWKAVKDALKAQEATNPGLVRQVRKALILADELKAKAPDGLDNLVQRMELVKQLDDDPEDPEYVPGTRTFDEVVSNTIAERTFWRDYDNAFQSGNPAVITQMLEANPESFQKLLPIAFDKFAEVNPDGFSSLVCKSVDGYLQSSQIPLQMALLERVLPTESNDPGMQTVISAFAEIKKVLGNISSWAQKPIQPKKVEGSTTQPGTTAQPSNTLEERELNVKNKEWAGEENPKSNAFAASEALRVFGEKKFTAKEIESLKAAVKTEINARTAINQNYQKRIKGFLKANNRTAYNMAVESEHRKIITGAIKRLGDDILAKRPAKQKPAVQQQAKSQNGQQTQADERFEMIAGAPRTQGLKVDFARNPPGWLEKNQAYVVGRKNPVKWRA